MVNYKIGVIEGVLIFADIPDYRIKRFDLISLDGDINSSADLIVPVHSIE
jgi:hypothetical protein